MLFSAACLAAFLVSNIRGRVQLEQVMCSSFFESATMSERIGWKVHLALMVPQILLVKDNSICDSHLGDSEYHLPHKDHLCLERRTVIFLCTQSPSPDTRHSRLYSEHDSILQTPWGRGLFFVGNGSNLYFLLSLCEMPPEWSKSRISQVFQDFSWIQRLIPKNNIISMEPNAPHTSNKREVKPKSIIFDHLNQVCQSIGSTNLLPS